jgi:hypothetical protein
VRRFADYQLAQQGARDATRVAIVEVGGQDGHAAEYSHVRDS